MKIYRNIFLIVFLYFLFITKINAETRNWTGNAGDNKISTSTNWSPVGSPVSGDSLIINTSSSSIDWDGSAPSTINALSLEGTFSGTLSLTGSLTVSTTLTVNKGTFQTAKDAVSDITVTNDFVIGANGTVIVRRSSTTGDGAGQTITASVVSVEGSLNADGAGFSAGQGPGAQSNTGGTHGGRGGEKYSSYVWFFYESFIARKWWRNGRRRWCHCHGYQWYPYCEWYVIC